MGSTTCSAQERDTIETLISNVKTFAGTADEGARRTLSKALVDVAVTLETSNDTILRLGYQPTELAVVLIGVNLGVFRILSEHGQPLSIGALALKTGADPVFLDRILRFLASSRLINEVAESLYSASALTNTLSRPSYAAGIRHHFYFMDPAVQALPKFLEDSKYVNPTRSTDCAFQTGHNTRKTASQWLQAHPFDLNNFVQYMNDYHDGKPIWTSSIKFEEECKDWSGEWPLFVDVGGAMGGQCVAFKKAAPNIPGRVILQDQESTLAHAPDIEGIEKMQVDFFQHQKVKGAKYYYLRNIIHDWPDDRCVVILQNIVDAMDVDSVLLINEVVVPDKGAHAQATYMDINMMAIGGMERTRKQWYELLEGKAGLKIKQLKTYSRFAGDSVIECVPADFV